MLGRKHIVIDPYIDMLFEVINSILNDFYKMINTILIT